MFRMPTSAMCDARGLDLVYITFLNPVLNPERPSVINKARATNYSYIPKPILEMLGNPKYLKFVIK
ncbi:MAG: hypothetical protein OXC46_04905 [Thaumarchaeota archaeon]|nr:hypothetical protein [Nitrososphaerota archaeon]